MSEGSHYARRLILTLIVVIILLLVWHTLHMFLLMFLGIILGIFLYRTGAWIAVRMHIGNRWGTVVVVLLVILAGAAAALFIMPRFLDQMERLADQLPGSWELLRETLARNRFGDWLLAHLPSLEQIAGSLGGLMHQATAWLYSAVGALTGALIIGVLGFYLAMDADLYVQGLVKLAPPGKRRRAARTLQGLGATLYWWLLGRLFSMLLIGVLTMLSLFLLGVPLALALGLFAAVMTFIPHLGPLIALAPAVLLALQQGWTRALYVVAAYTAIQTVESYVITPLIQRQNIALPPALILSAQLIMGVVQGIIGLLAATPLLAAIIVLTKLLYVEDVLGDHDLEIQAEAKKTSD